MKGPVKVIHAKPEGYRHKKTRTLAEEFDEMGGDPAFLHFAKLRLKTAVAFSQPRIPAGSAQRLKHSLGQARVEAEKLLKIFPKPTRDEIIACSKPPGDRDIHFPRAWIINPYLAAREMIHRLEHEEKVAEFWELHEKHQRGAIPSSRKPEVLYWFAILGCYTTILSGEPQWK